MEHKVKNKIITILKWVIPLVAVIVAVMICNATLIINSRVVSASMETTIMTGDHVIGSRLAYKTHEIERGDIIMFDSQVDVGNVYVKRVIGLPGDTVRIENGEIYINDSTDPLEEDYINTWTIDDDHLLIYEVPEDSYFVMGDNRDDSFDSRFWKAYMIDKKNISDIAANKYAYVKEDDILGKALFKLFPHVGPLK